MSQGIININSNEINDVISKLNDSINDLQNNAYEHVDRDYSDLSELDLLGDGINNTKTGINKVIEAETNVIKLLKNHLETCYNTEEEIVNYINSFDYSNNKVNRVNSFSEYEQSDMDEVRNERIITKSNIKDFITESNTSIQKILLKNINKNVSLFTTDVNELLINPEKSGLLVEILKKICGDTNIEIDTTNTNATKNIQKILLAKINNNDTNIYSEIIGKSLLVALPYIAKKSENEKIKFDDLLYKEENKEKLLGTLNDLYQGKNIDGYSLTIDEINNFREYINDVADANNIKVENLLTEVANLDLIKKGVSL